MENTTNRELIIEAFKNNPKLFIDLISNYYPLKLDILLEHKDILNWQLLSANENLEWDLGTENPFEKDLNWSIISDYEHFRGLATTKEKHNLIDVFIDKWEWLWLSDN